MPHIPHQAGTKFSNTEHEEVLAKVTALDRRGFRQCQIAEVIGVAQPTVCYYLKKIRQRYKESSLKDRDEVVNGILAQIDEVMVQAWNAWDQSKEDKQRIISEEITSANALGTWTRSKTGEEKERQTGHCAYLAIIMDCIKRKCQVLGLDAPKRVDATVSTLNWDVMAKTDTRNKANSIEQMIANAQVITVNTTVNESEGTQQEISERNSIEISEEGDNEDIQDREST